MATSKRKDKQEESEKFSLSKINTSLIFREDINTGTLPLWTYCREKVGKKELEPGEKYIIEYSDENSSYRIEPRGGMPGPIDHHFFRTVEMITTEIYLKNKFVPKTIFLGTPNEFLRKAGIPKPNNEDYKRFDDFLTRTKGLLIDATQRWKIYSQEQAKMMADDKAKRKKQAESGEKVDEPLEILAWKWAQSDKTILLYSGIHRAGTALPGGEKSLQGSG